MTEKRKFVDILKNINPSYHINLFIRCLIPTLSIVLAIAIMLIAIPSSVTDIFMFDLSYVQFLARILVIIFMYNIGNFIIREIVLGVT
jgi:hypothetical protein